VGLLLGMGLCVTSPDGRLVSIAPRNAVPTEGALTFGEGVAGRSLISARKTTDAERGSRSHPTLEGAEGYAQIHCESALGA
jgi:hypothetical protein